MNVAVIGAGWAGLSAALELHHNGHGVTVFEAGHRLGGRARGVHWPKLDATLDNGQHIMLGAYTETLALMRRLKLDPDALLYGMPLALQSADQRFALRVPDIAGPLALPVALLRAQGIGWMERLRLAALLSRLSWRDWITDLGARSTQQQKQKKAAAGKPTVAQWLARGRQSPRLIQSFWEPLCLATMNTPTHRACAQLFANVLRDSLGAGPNACRVLISRVDLSSLWPEQLPAEISIKRGHAVRHLEADGCGVLIEGQAFDAVVIATNVQPARRLLGQLPCTPGSQEYLAMLSAFEPLPIATLTLELSDHWDMPHAMLMLAEHPKRRHFGQWLFHCNVFLDEPLATSRLNVVISHAVDLPNWSVEEIVDGVLEQINEQATQFAPVPAVRAYELISEKRATFAAVPGLKRPSNITPWPQVYAAGDWTDTGYPAVLEGAVRSGLAAARAVNAGHTCDLGDGI
ncbi:hydroxysqualene dehydroxylase HpnE [Pusillimonas sp.]|uniref:hydroxysqualene dehydroxylase HpnE n=1 Tax=Pusillimonas sp. TaxID=3040095 RepID=UPI0037CADE3B